MRDQPVTVTGVVIIVFQIERRRPSGVRPAQIHIEPFSVQKDLVPCVIRCEIVRLSFADGRTENRDAWNVGAVHEILKYLRIAVADDFPVFEKSNDGMRVFRIDGATVRVAERVSIGRIGCNGVFRFENRVLFAVGVRDVLTVKTVGVPGKRIVRVDGESVVGVTGQFPRLVITNRKRQ